MNAAPQPEGNLPAARRQLAAAISALIEPKPVVVNRDDGSMPVTWLDSLYDQLCDAVAGQTGERSGGASTVPVWADVLDELTRINRKIAEWHPQFPQPDAGCSDPTPTPIARLHAIQARKWRVEDTGLVETIAATIVGFCDTIRAKLTPEPVIYLMAPAPEKGAAKCPACQTDYVWRPDPSENNKPKRQPALKVSKDGCVCQNPRCRTTWEPGALRILAGALGYPLPAGVLE